MSEASPTIQAGRRAAIAAVVFAAVLLLQPNRWGWPARGVAAWDAAVVAFLGLAWFTILRADPDDTRRRAAADDPGAVAVLITALLASGAGFGAAVVVLRDTARYLPNQPEWVAVVVGGGAVGTAWALLHTAFAFHYARLYYTPEDAPGGLAFPGGPPDDLDFAYFAFTLGMSYAASDVAVTDRAIRRLVLGHAVVAFLYNTTILALAVSLLFGKVG